MPIRIRRLAITGALAAGAIAIPIAALASGSDSPTKPAATASATAAAKSAAAPVAPLDSSAAAVKSAAAASKSAAAGSDTPSITGPAAVVAFAGALGVGHDAARQALQQLAELGGSGGVDTTDPAFAAIAHGLGVTPEQLAAAVGQVKRALASR